MKKIIFSALVLGLAFGAFQNSWARDSTSLGLNNTLRSDVTDADDGVPIGTVVAWPYEFLPSNGKWAECNGQIVNGIRTPDYRGMFLRGHGDGSSKLGEIQDWGIPEQMGKGSTGGFIGISGFYSRDVFSQRDIGWGGQSWGGGAERLWEINFDAWGNVDQKHKTDEIRPVNMAVKYIIKVR